MIIGFWGLFYSTMNITRNPQSSVGNYLGPCIKVPGAG